MANYIVAPKRGSRPAQADCDWKCLLVPIAGLRVCGSTPRRAVIEASEEALAEARRKLGPDFRIEPQIEHRTASAT
ncbi:MAG TPA: hypothetical protein VK943_13345 [Arenibaculum sp.]|nr:hypothetical protein [Arenibaculum sp.]